MQVCSTTLLKKQIYVNLKIYEFDTAIIIAKVVPLYQI